MKHFISIFLLTAILLFSFTACDTLGDKNPNEPTSAIPIQLSNTNIVTAASEMSSETIPYELETVYKDQNGYIIFQYYLGQVKNVPLKTAETEQKILQFTGIPYTDSYTTSKTSAITIAETAEEVTSKTVSNYDSKTVDHGIKVGAETTFGVNIFLKSETKFSAEFEAKQSKTYGNQTDKSTSIANSYTTSDSSEETKQETTTISFTDDFQHGFYKFVHLGVFDIFSAVILDSKTGQYDIQHFAYLKTSFCNFIFSETGDFSFNSTDDLTFDESYLEHLVIPDDLEESSSNNSDNPNIPNTPTTPISLDMTHDKSTFEADIYNEDQKQGRAEFSVEGALVQYKGRKYIYGTAFYSGNLTNGTYFDDVAELSLQNANVNILLGGNLSWWSTVGDNDECGMAAWQYEKALLNSNCCKYFVDSPNKDMAGNEKTSISISNICVEVGELSDSEKETLPEVVHKEKYFYATLFTEKGVWNPMFEKYEYREETQQDTLYFDVFGIKALYKGEEYIYGSAYYSGTPGGKQINDVKVIRLKNCNKEVLSGGTLSYVGNAANNDGNAFCSCVTSNTELTTTLDYGLVWLENDFQGTRENFISISGLIFKTDEELDINYNYAKLGTGTFEAGLYNEERFAGSLRFTTVGLTIKKDDTLYLFGSAYYTGTPDGERKNDVQTLRLEALEEKTLFGGILFWRNTLGNNDECGNATWDKQDDKQKLYYVAYQPNNDNASNEETIVSITGICVEYVPDNTDRKGN